MWKLLKLAVVVFLIVGAFRVGTVVNDRQTLSEDIVRLHIVADSDEEADQQLKLQVRDAVLEYLEEAASALNSAEEAKEFLQGQLETIRQIAQEVVAAAGSEDGVSVSLTREEFDTREYDTFTLPAGVYDSLRIVIGEGEGHNWWCVVFPKLCTPVSCEDFEDVAAGAGFSQTLTGTISNDGGYEIRFFLLDCLGKIQNFFNGL